MLRFNKIKNGTSGMTIPEVITAITLGMILMGIVLSMWYFSYRNWTLERIRSKLRINLEIAMEQLKEEVRLSSTTYTSLYLPASETEYKAISFPQATADSNGFFTLVTEDEIYWDKSVVYHVYDNAGTTELRKTTFTDNNSVLTDKTQRESQLSTVVADGDGSSATNGANATTKVIFENLVDLTITPQAQEFDGYSATTTRSDNVEFGSVRLDPGYHELKFTVTENNPSSSGYAIGVDSLTISPSGGQREAEYYNPPYATSGDSASKVYAIGWSGNNYLEYGSDSIGDYVVFRLYYDLWRESNFDGAVLENTILTGNDLYAKLAEPKEGGTGMWYASTQIGVNSVDYPEAGESVVLPANIAIRNILSSSAIEQDGELSRFRFVSHSLADLVVSEAWLVERSSNDDGTGTAVQLFFSDTPVLVGEEELDTSGDEIGGTVGVTPTSITIPAGSYVYSNWAVFAIDMTKDYFITFATPAANVVYWKPTVAGSANSYYSELDSAASSGWTNSTATDYIFATEDAETWTSQGTVTSAIYDSKLSNPGYTGISWSQYVPAGTTVVVKGRSSDDSTMSGATAWSSIPASTISNSDGRYVQFQATFTASDPYDDLPWIDDVTIDWPGEAKMCDISGYFTQKPNYGIIKLTVDGEELTKGLEFSITVSEDFQGETYEAFGSTEAEPRNTGR